MKAIHYLKKKTASVLGLKGTEDADSTSSSPLQKGKTKLQKKSRDAPTRYHFSSSTKFPGQSAVERYLRDASNAEFNFVERHEANYSASNIAQSSAATSSYYASSQIPAQAVNNTSRPEQSYAELFRAASHAEAKLWEQYIPNSPRYTAQCSAATASGHHSRQAGLPDYSGLFEAAASESLVGRYDLPVHPGNMMGRYNLSVHPTNISRTTSRETFTANSKGKEHPMPGAWPSTNPFKDAAMARDRWAASQSAVNNQSAEASRRQGVHGSSASNGDDQLNQISEMLNGLYDALGRIASIPEVPQGRADSGVEVPESGASSSTPKRRKGKNRAIDADDEVLRHIQLMEDELTARKMQDRIWQEQQEEDRHAECAVCNDRKEKLEFPARPATESCEHQPHICKECLDSWVDAELQAKGTNGIRCPECRNTLTHIDVQKAASAETFAAYDKIATRNALSSLPDFGWCLNPKCDNGQLNPENGNYMDCGACGYKQCLLHRVPWHKDETCKQYNYRTSGQKAKDEEAKTNAMLDSMSKVCPGKNCGWRIQKTTGCEHMTCRKCRHEFCWLCLAPQTEIRRIGNTAHAVNCKFHSNNLEPSYPFNVH